MKRFLIVVWAVGAAMAAQVVWGQGYPMPGSTSEPPVMCTVCVGAQQGLPTYPYAPPIRDHAGRFLDSARTRDYQHGFGGGYEMRTLRAELAWVAPEANRVYMVLGETFAAYNLDNFFNSKLGSPMRELDHAYSPTGYREKYLQWDAAVYAETPSSGWTTGIAEGQQRLFDADNDDRGYVYLAYGIFGWGIHKDNGGGSLQFTIQVDEGYPQGIRVFRDGAKYYALVWGEMLPVIYDVTTPAAPVKVGNLNFGPLAVEVVSTSGGDVIGIVGGGAVDLFTPQGLRSGSPFQSFEMPGNSPWIDLATDGVSFYAVSRTPAKRIAVISNEGGSFTYRDFPTRGELQSVTGIGAGAGHLAVWGYTSQSVTTALYRLENGAPVELPIDDFFRKYYGDPAPAGYATPSSWGSYGTLVNDISFARHGGKIYMFYSGYGLGDVYEIAAGDTISVTVDPNGNGVRTANPFSTTNGTGPYYGDPIRFLSSSSGSPMSIVWNFGNPEAPSNGPDTVRNTLSGKTTGSPVVHQYSNLTAGGAVARKTVKASSATDSSNGSTAFVEMDAPAVRIGLESTPGVALTGTTAALLLGDEFVDASDGSVESHYSVWTIDGTNTTGLPTAPVSVGGCTDARAVRLSGYYGPYIDAGTPVAGTQPLIVTSPEITYSVGAIAPAIQLPASSSSNITLSNKTRFAGGLPGGTALTVTWKLLDGTSVLDEETHAITIAQLASDTFTIPVNQGTSVELTVALVDPSLITDVTCSASMSASVELIPPDPVIEITGCASVGQECSAVAESASGLDQSAWTYRWTFNGQVRGTGRTVDLKNFVVEGSNSLQVRATNVFGATTDSAAFTAQAPVCATPPPFFSITPVGANTGCIPNGSATGCTSSTEPIHFTASAFGGSFKDCDQFLWSFPDGSTSTQREPTKTFSGNGPHRVTLKVSNTAFPAGSTQEYNVRFGSAPPPPPPTCQTAPGSFSTFFNGPQSGCTFSNPNCITGESIQFQAQPFNYTVQGCDTFAWNFGDGTTSAQQNPVKTYSSPGQRTVTFRASNQNGSSLTYTLTVNVTGEGEEPQCNTPPGGSLDFTWSGSSGCNVNTQCQPGETVTFNSVIWLYTLRECDTVEWNFGNGVTKQGRQVTHTFGNGAHSVSMRIVNAAGATTPVSRVVQVGNPIERPTSVDFTWSANPIVGRSVTFTATATAPVNHPVNQWQWTFGEGVQATGNPVTHTFSTAADWSVSLVASNEGGPAPTVTKTVSVADANSFVYMLPAVAHVGPWRTDLHIYNPNAANGTTVDLEFELTGVGVKKTLPLTSATLIYPEFGSFFEQTSVAGSVIVRGIAPEDLQIWTRNYVVSDTGVGTYGHVVPAIKLDTNQSLSTPTTYYLSGARSTARYRTNIGLLNLAPAAQNVTVVVYEGNFGAPLGQFTYDLPSNQLRQLYGDDIRAQIPTLPTDKPYSIAIQGAFEGSLVAYGSMIDNVSQDPVYLEALSIPNLEDPALRSQIVPGIARTGLWRSDVTIFNPDDQAIQLDVAFHGVAGGSPVTSSANDLIIPAKGMMQLDDILMHERMVAPILDATGFLKVTVDSPLADEFPYIVDRTYSDLGAAGTFGQGIAGFASSKPNVVSGTPAVIPGVRSDQLYYTNVGLLNPGSTDANVLITLQDKNSGQAIAAHTVHLEPNESIVLLDLIKYFNDVTGRAEDRGSFKIEAATGSVWAFATVIDKQTRDPEYVPAVPMD